MSRSCCCCCFRSSLWFVHSCCGRTLLVAVQSLKVVASSSVSMGNGYWDLTVQSSCRTRNWWAFLAPWQEFLALSSSHDCRHSCCQSPHQFRTPYPWWQWVIFVWTTSGAAVVAISAHTITASAVAENEGQNANSEDRNFHLFQFLVLRILLSATSLLIN